MEAVAELNYETPCTKLDTTVRPEKECDTGVVHVPVSVTSVNTKGAQKQEKVTVR